ncbi:hypothetical protein BDZ89DRAFT_1137117 [Hymenopellis radicata]|nr:hypothetical protein BDZ89DRAFT_1137117 [Hymenopellis radicata]
MAIVEQQWDDACELIDATHIRIAGAITTLWTRRNALQSVNKIPPAVLEVIIRETQELLPDFMPIRPAGYDSRRWMSMRLVCRHWNDIISLSTHLWNVVDIAHFPTKSISKSLFSPLVVYWGRNGTSDFDCGEGFALLKPHIARMRELRLNLYRGSPMDILQELSLRAPLLESLSIYLLRDVTAIGDVLPSFLFDGHMPRLKKLTLEHFSKWPHHNLSGLTHVCLQRQQPHSRPTTGAFLDFLEGCPDLEELILYKAGPTLEMEPAVDAGRIVALPRLRELGWGGLDNLASAERLLRHLSLPKETRLYFWHESYTDDFSISPLIPKDLNYLPCMTNIVEWRMSCVFLDRRLSDPERCLRKQIVAFVSGVLYTLGLPTVRNVQDIVCPYSGVVRGVKKFLVLEYIDIQRRTWMDIFDDLPNLEELVLQPPEGFVSSRYILSSLYSSPSWSWPILRLRVLCKRTCPPPCPKLKVLRIQCDSENQTYLLGQLAKARKKFGFPLKVLDVSLCSNPSCPGYNGTRRLSEFAWGDNLVLQRWVKDVDGSYKRCMDVLMDLEGWPTRGFEWTAI